MKTESDEMLMQGLQGGREQAFEELVNRWARPLRSFLGRMSRDPTAADEAYQEVWTRVYLYRAKYRPEARFKSYLFSIAVNVCRTAISVRRRWDNLFVSMEDGEHAGSDDAPLEKIIRSEQDGLVREAIDHLPDAQRAIVLLYFLLGQDYSSIAQAMDRTEETIRSNMHHALRKLRGVLTRSLHAQLQVDHERKR